MNINNNNISSNFRKYQNRHPFAVKQLAKFYSSLIKTITKVKHGRMLSIGCGECFDLKKIQDHNNINIEYYYGLDSNYQSLQTAKKLATNRPLNLVQGDILKSPVIFSKVDLILGLEILEHLSSPDKVLKQISKQFKGYCIFSVPNEPLFRLTRLLLFQQNIRAFGNHPEHLHNWSKHSFARLIRKYFIIEEISTPSLWTIILCRNAKK
jgi:SAM-dependent methyltransferase